MNSNPRISFLLYTCVHSTYTGVQYTSVQQELVFTKWMVIGHAKLKLHTHGSCRGI